MLVLGTLGAIGVVILGLILPIIITTAIAARSGRDAVGWFLLSILISWLGPFLVLLCGRTPKAEAKRMHEINRHLDALEAKDEFRSASLDDRGQKAKEGQDK